MRLMYSAYNCRLHSLGQAARRRVSGRARSTWQLFHGARPPLRIGLLRHAGPPPGALPGKRLLSRPISRPSRAPLQAPHSRSPSLPAKHSTSHAELFQHTTTSGAPTLSITGTLKLNTLAYSGTKTLTTTINSGGVLQLRTSITDSGSAQTITDNGTLIGAGSVASGVTLAGTGTVKASGGTLICWAQCSSGPTLAIDTTAGSDLKIDGTATSKAITINNANQTLEVGATGELTISAAQNVTRRHHQAGWRHAHGQQRKFSLGTTTSNGSLSGFGMVTAALTRSGSGQPIQSRHPAATSRCPRPSAPTRGWCSTSPTAPRLSCKLTPAGDREHVHVPWLGGRPRAGQCEDIQRQGWPASMSGPI